MNVNAMFAVCSLAIATSFLRCDNVGAQVTASKEGLQRPDKLPNDSFSLSIEPPAAVNEHEIARWVRILNLADAQKLFLARLFDEYKVSFETKKRSEIAVLRVLAQEGGRAFSTGRPNKHDVEIYAAFAKEEDRVAKELRAIEQPFFEQLPSILSSEQLEKLDRVQLDRERTCAKILDIAIPGARIDLTRFIEQFGMTSEDLSGVDSELAEYERAVTPLFVGLRKSTNKNRVQIQMLQVTRRYNDAGEPYKRDDPERIAKTKSVLAETAKLLDESATLQRRIAEINDKYLLRLTEALPNDASRVVRQAYAGRAYPRVFPDSEDPEPIYLKLSNAQTISQDVQEDILSNWVSFRFGYDSICKQMIEEYNNWCDKVAHSATGNGYDRYRETMRELRSKRWSMNEQFLNHLKALQDQGSLGEVQVEIQDVLDRISAARMAFETDRWPSPAP